MLYKNSVLGFAELSCVFLQLVSGWFLEGEAQISKKSLNSRKRV